MPDPLRAGQQYGNGQPWPDTEPAAPAPACEHTDTHTTTIPAYWHRQHGHIPAETVVKCTSCRAILKRGVKR